MDSDKYHDGAARPTSMDPEAGSVGPTRRRWAVLGAFSFLSGLNNFIWISFAPVRSATAGYYGVSGDAVDWLSPPPPSSSSPSATPKGDRPRAPASPARPRG